MGLTEKQLVREIETQAAKAQHEIATVKAVMAAKQRDVRMLDLTASEMKTLPEDTPMYGGVGRMHVSPSPSSASVPLTPAQGSSRGPGTKSKRGWRPRWTA